MLLLFFKLKIVCVRCTFLLGSLRERKRSSHFMHLSSLPNMTAFKLKILLAMSLSKTSSLIQISSISVIKLQLIFLAASPNFTIALPQVSPDFTFHRCHQTSPISCMQHHQTFLFELQNFTALQVTPVTSMYSPLILLERM